MATVAWMLVTAAAVLTGCEGWTVLVGEDGEPFVPEGYERLANGGVYKLHEETRPWHKARRACEREGAHLAVVNSVDEARALRDFIFLKDISFLHAGFRLSLRTTQGERISYEEWSSSGPLSNFCGQMDDDVWLLYGSCSERLPFICEYEPQPGPNAAGRAALEPVLPTAEVSNATLQLLEGRGYSPLPGWNRSLIKNFGQRQFTASWEEAKRKCEEDGAQLVKVESVEKADALVAFVESATIENFYLDVKTGDPVTVLGRPLHYIRYQRWRTRRPQASHFCLYSSKKLTFDAIQCVEKYFRHITLNILCEVAVN